MSCDKFAKELNVEWKRKLARCPKCKALIEKNDGC
jgi:hypothetical protein